jgi:hypothetical protein
LRTGTPLFSLKEGYSIRIEHIRIYNVACVVLFPDDDEYRVGNSGRDIKKDFGVNEV